MTAQGRKVFSRSRGSTRAPIADAESSLGTEHEVQTEDRGFAFSIDENAQVANDLIVRSYQKRNLIQSLEEYANEIKEIQSRRAELNKDWNEKFKAFIRTPAGIGLEELDQYKMAFAMHVVNFNKELKDCAVKITEMQQKLMTLPNARPFLGALQELQHLVSNSPAFCSINDEFRWFFRGSPRLYFIRQKAEKERHEAIVDWQMTAGRECDAARKAKSTLVSHTLTWEYAMDKYRRISALSQHISQLEQDLYCEARECIV
ncbi:hypothetical protein Ciccas_006288 [Cichlidogyrus casuarinus]|uniref:Uncharacterized protein n=1 Tax=Cichlidogyrus casuarinus TaxID=1844966 RepID=A0ABD2Q772_9PLAT